MVCEVAQHRVVSMFVQKVEPYFIMLLLGFSGTQFYVLDGSQALMYWGAIHETNQVSKFSDKSYLASGTSCYCGAMHHFTQDAEKESRHFW